MDTVCKGIKYEDVEALLVAIFLYLDNFFHEITRMTPVSGIHFIHFDFE